MEQLIERAKVVLDESNKILGMLKGERGKIAEISQKQDKVAEFQAGQIVEIEAREAAVKPIEDIVVFKEAAEKLAKEVDDGRIVLANAKQSFEDYKASEKAKLATQKAEVDKLEALYKRELEALKKAIKDTEEEKAKIGTKIVEGITEGLKK